MSFSAVSTSEPRHLRRHDRPASHPAGQLVREWRGWGTPAQIASPYPWARYAYTANGQRASVWDANDSRTAYTYDGFDRLTRTRFPNPADGSANAGDDERLSYDKAGNIVSRTTRSNVAIGYGYGYDRLDRMVSKAAGANAAAPARATSYAYDLAGRQSEVSDDQGHRLSYGYDPDTRRLASTQTRGPQWGGSKTVAYRYDPAGNRTELRWGAAGDTGAWRALYGYDGLNRMISVSDQASDDASPARLAALAWTPLSKPQRLDYGPAGASVAGVAATYTASGAGADVERLSHDFAAGGNDVGFDYTYFADHRLASQSISRPSFRPAAPAPFSQGYSPDRLNRYASVSGPVGAPPITFTYDGNGNLASDGSTAYAYDPENRLLWADNVLMGALYDSDPFGRRVRKRVTDKLASPQTTASTSYQLDGDPGSGAGAGSEIAEWSGGSLLRRFIPGPAIDRPAAMVFPDGGRRFFHADRQGSVIALSDGAGALADGPYAYDPYGQPQGAGLAATLTDSPYLFTGRRYDPETGLYYLRARYYSPDRGRFNQTDPVGYDAGDLNPYTYVGNDPLNAADPMGTIACAGASNCQVYAGAAFGPRMEEGGGERTRPETARVLPPPAPVVAGGAARAAAQAGATAVGSATTAAAASAAGAAAVLFWPSQTASDDTTPQWVVRGGLAQAASLEAGTAQTGNGYGFSVQTAPGTTIDELARGGAFPHRSISVSTIQRLQESGAIIVRYPTAGYGDYHGTVVLPNPPTSGIFMRLEQAFYSLPNPHPVPRR